MNSDPTTGLQPMSEPPWSQPSTQIADQLRVDELKGLSASEAADRLRHIGPNRLREIARPGPLKIFLRQFLDWMIVLLMAAAGISLLVGEVTDAILIVVIISANAVLGFVQEWKAENAVAALKQLSEPTVHVRRDGRVAERPAADLVPGDLVELTGGCFVPADIRLVETAELQTDESALTGESQPIEKSIEPLPIETPLPDRLSMAFAGTFVSAGRGRGIVTATGMQTELGNVATLLESAETVQTPLQRRLAALSRTLAIVVIGVAIIIFAAGVLRESPADWNRELFSEMLLIGVSLAVAAIPEGLPAVITVTLALGSARMSARKAIIRRLPAVETLGSVNVICTDKTGTLTQNRMTAVDLIPATGGDDKAALQRMLQAAVLCNDADVTESGQIVGSATEGAILQAAIERGVDPTALRGQWRRIGEIPFSSSRKRMTTLHQDPDGNTVLFEKGAAENILDRCSDRNGTGTPSAQATATASGTKDWRAEIESLAQRGRRVLAVASSSEDGHDLTADDDDSHRPPLTLLGLIGIVDPVRPEAKLSIASCRTAGIRPVMITGDHAITARAIAEELDLWREGDQIVTGPELDRLDDREFQSLAPDVVIYARVSPEHKLRIVRAHQSHGNVVAMTGDGVNDAPALKQADIGVAMGQTGTDVSKQAADMLLANDNFATIVTAVEEGRVVYDNIRKFVHYLLAANTGEIFLLLFAILLGYPLPLLPVQILWINLVTDGLPALALGFEKAEPDIMKRRPRDRDESILSRGMLIGIALVGLLMAVSCLALFQYSLPDTIREKGVQASESASHAIAQARSIVFLTLSMFQLFFVLSIRSSVRSYFGLGFGSNLRLTAAVIVGAALQLTVIYAPPLQPIFHTVSLSAADLMIGLGVSTFAFIAVELWKLARRTPMHTVGTG